MLSRSKKEAKTERPEAPAAGQSEAERPAGIALVASPGPSPDARPEHAVGKRLVPQREGLQWRHGIVDFKGTGNRSRYIIVPVDCEDAVDLLKAVCRIWDLRLPPLLLNFDGGHDVPCNWFDHLMEPQVFLDQVPDKSPSEARKVFCDSLERTFAAVASACAESKAWVWTHVEALGDVFLEGKTELFGKARTRAKSNNRLYHWAAYSEEECGPMWGMENFMELSVLEGGTIKEHVEYPAMRHHYVSEGKDGAQIFNANPGNGLPFAASVLQGQATNIIIHPEGCRLRRNGFMELLTEIVPTIGLAANGFYGNEAYWYKLSQQQPFILLRHTGAATDLVCRAIDCRRQFKARAEQTFSYTRHDTDKEENYCLPTTTNENQFIILDATRDSTDRIVDKVLMCVSLVEDDEARELGGKDMDRSRLVEAWNRILELRANADAQWRLSNLLHYLIMVVSVLTALMSVGYESFAHCGEDGICLPPHWLSVMKWGVSLLPLIAAFLLSCNSSFSPQAKAIQLSSAAIAMETELYAYRTRVKEYTPRLKKDVLGEEFAANTSAPNQTRARSQSKAEKKKALGLRSMTRRGAFAKNLEEIYNKTMNGDIRTGSLTPLRPGAFHDFQKSLSSAQGRDPRAMQMTESTELLLATTDGDDHQAFGSIATDTPVNDGLSILNADDYMLFRLYPTLSYLKKRAPQLERRIVLCRIAIFLATSANAVLALLSQNKEEASQGTSWMPVVIALTSAIGAFMDYEMLTTKLIFVNSALLQLENLLSWWGSLSLVEKRLDSSKQYLVEVTESACNAEHNWARTPSSKKPKAKKTGDADEEDDDDEEDQKDKA